MLATLFCAFAASAGSPHTSLHPANADLYAEVADVQALVRGYATAPSARFVGDEDVQKLGTLTKFVGIDELGTLVRSALPRLSADANASGIFDAGELTAVTLSVAGYDRAPGSTDDTTQFLVVCDFASEAGASRMVPALEKAQWLVPPRSTSANATSSGDDVVDLGGGPVRVSRHTLAFFGTAFDAWSAQTGTRWILGAGRTTPAEVTERIAGKRSSLAARDVLFAAQTSFTPATGTVVARVHADMERTPFVDDDTSPFTSALVTALFPFAGARGTWRIELRGERFVTEGAFTRIAAPTPLDTFVAGTPVQRGSVDFVPPNAVGAWALPVKAAQLPALLATWIAPAPDAKPIADEKRAELAARLERALGTNASVALLPFASVQSFTPQILVTLELRDRDVFLAALDTWTAQMREQRPDLTVEDRPYHKQPIRVFSVPPAPRTATPRAPALPLLGAVNVGDDVAPAIAVLADRVLIALKVTQLRSEIQRLEKSAEAGATPQLHVLAAAGRFPEGALEASSIDWAGLFGKLYDVARGFLPMLAQGQPLPFDPATLPSAASFTKFFQPSFAWTKRTDSGFYSHAESSFGPETPLTLAALFAGLERTQSTRPPGLFGGALAAGRGEKPAAGGAPAATNTPNSSTPTTTTPAKPAVDLSREKTLKALKSVKLGIAVYRSQTGHPPDALARLLEGMESFPKGFLDPPEIPKDAWGREIRYAIAADGVNCKLWSLGPDGEDQNGAGDDVPLP